MASIEKRTSKAGDTSYHITVSLGYNEVGKKQTVKEVYKADASLTPFKAMKQAKQYAAELEEKVLHGNYQGSKLTLKDFSKQWLDEYVSQLAIRTQEDYKKILEQRIIPKLGHIKLADISVSSINSFYMHLTQTGIRFDKKEGGYKNATLIKTNAVLSSLFTYAVRLEIINDNPCKKANKPRKSSEVTIKETEDTITIHHPRTEEKIVCFTLEQAQTFLEALDKEYSFPYKERKRTAKDGSIVNIKPYQVKKTISLQFKVLFNIALFGGLRKGELLGLKWSNIDLTTGQITIAQTIQRVNGKTIITDPKTRNSARTISLPPVVMALLKQHKIEQFKLRLGMGNQWKGDDWLFTQENGKVMHPSTPYHKFHEVTELYNKTVENESEKLPIIKFHGTRHTHATLLFSTDVDIPTISKRLGHKDLSTTLNIYAHTYEELDQKASNKINDILSIKNA